MTGPKSSAIALLVLLTCCGPGISRAADEEDSLPNYAFAAYLGNGIYSASGRSVRVYNLPLAFTLRSLEDHQQGIRLKIPVSLGLFDFEAVDIIEAGLPESVETVSVVPGVELRFPVRDGWVLMPFLDLGAGRNSTGGQVTYIFGTGVKSLVTFRWGGVTCRLGNNLVYAGNRAPGVELSSDYGSLVTGLDGRVPVNFTLGGHRADVSLYAMNFLYANLEFLRFRAGPADVVVQYETGITFGTTTRPGNWLARQIHRLGLGYRFGDGLSVWRLVLGMPF
jgi:hypothetical protein